MKLATVCVTYRRGSPQHMRVFRSRRDAQRFVDRQEWPHNWIIHQRRVIAEAR